MAIRPDWLDPEPWRQVAAHADTRDVRAAVFCERPAAREFAALLSPAATGNLDMLAGRAQDLTRRHFGRTISLYVPLYLSDFCTGGCVYCGFAADRTHNRRRLDRRQLEEEMEALHGMGYEDVLLLTGERCAEADFAYLKDCVAAAARRFHNVSAEAFAMTEDEYRQLVDAGCTGVTLYQETYDPDLYASLHRWGEKRDYNNRLDTPNRALRAGIRSFGMGALLGLGDAVTEAISLFLHAERLMMEFWQAGISISFPRVRKQAGGYEASSPVKDRFLAQMIFAFRICFPEVPLVLSTRESPSFRDGMAGVGISRMSVGSRTTVGGYADAGNCADGQFDVCDDRGVSQFCENLRAKGLFPVFKNWDSVFTLDAAQA